MKLQSFSVKSYDLKANFHSIIKDLTSFIFIKKFRWLRVNWIIKQIFKVANELFEIIQYK